VRHAYESSGLFLLKTEEKETRESSIASPEKPFSYPWKTTKKT